MVVVRWWIVVSLHRRKRDGGSGGGSVEDGWSGPWPDIQTGISKGWPYADNGRVPGRWYLVRSACWGNRSRVWFDGVWRLDRPYNHHSARGAERRSFLLSALP
ncbi:hypothetical protein DPMN_187360 [Dreissena polymorpha]|uniref:Uncharacterized protein n=1 Tax=Dreissena polymorpha TaxID=45954 RepID=A0A9D4DRY9_DREPO|nr:hypothetical protein DPMN_187360 [Dreissena polymorpha]